MGDQSCPTYAVGKPTLRQETTENSPFFPFRARNTEIILGDKTFNLHYEMSLSDILKSAP